MSKKIILSDPFQPKITRNDRFAQMSHQEKVIEQKKREIQAKLEAKQKNLTTEIPKSTPVTIKQVKSSTSKADQKKPVNVFSNDGSFLDTFKQMKDKKLDSKLKSFKARENFDKNYGNKVSRWSQRRRSPSPKDKRNLKSRISRFTDKTNNFEHKITINTSFNNNTVSHTYENTISVSPQVVTGQPLLKNILPTQNVTYPTVPQSNATASVIAAPPLLLNVPPPQIVQSQTLLLPSSTENVLVSTSGVNVTLPAVLTTVSLPPPTIITTQTVTVSNTSVPPSVCELASIPPPNPIQVQNIPPPEPLNALNIPHPAPIQVQNIPTPTAIQLNEIPKPKPLDLLAIPTPNEETKTISDPNFIKNVPPPNKSIPPPSIPTETNINVPPPNLPQQPPPPPPPPQTQNITIQNLTPCQNILVHTIPPPTQIIQAASGVPPPNIQSTTSQNFTSISVVGVVPTNTVPVNNTIPSLMAQPILPPPGMGVTTVNVSCPPPSIISNLQTPPPNFVNQPPPINNSMPPMNIPPPSTNIHNLINSVLPPPPTFRDMNTVFTPGAPDYEAMMSLGRMVAQCGPGIEEVVRQRKNQDPSLWFLFHKESAAYRQYQQIIDQFKREIENEQKKSSQYKPEDIYEPDKPIEDDDQIIKSEDQDKKEDDQCASKRKRRSRWGDKDVTIPPPIVLKSQKSSLSQQPSNFPILLSKITRNDPALIQYAMNTYGSSNLSEEEWKNVEDNFKINLLYQDMMKKKEEVEKLQLSGKNKYDYDSDEDIEGGTWEHKLRDKEMMATQLWAQELTRQGEGKHHIGDFLPAEELKKFMEKINPTSTTKDSPEVTFSDYQEFKIKEDNIGFKMLQKLGWSEGQGLGSKGSGIVEPVPKGSNREQNQGLGLEENDSSKDDEYEAYRKRMMLAYRFRPNPLNNPRRPYY